MSKTLNPLSKAAQDAAFAAMTHPRDFRPFVPAKAPPELNTPRRERTAQAMATLPDFRDNYHLSEELMAEPYRGITTDGRLRPQGRKPAPNGAPRSAMDAAGAAFLAVLRSELAARIRFPADAPEWRRWHNMPACWERDGAGLEEMDEAEREAFRGLLRASLSDWGYTHVLDLMAVNRFMGDLVGRPRYLNENSYSVGVFGEPGETVWGWQLYGHHICLNCRLIGDHYILSPTLFAAEPGYIDEGPRKGLSAFTENEEAGLALIRGLPETQRAKAILARSILNADLPPGRRHWADSLHLGGAFQDNRTIPTEGVCAADFGAADRARLLTAVETFLMAMPDGPRAARMAEIAARIDETWFCWMGGTDDWQPFYYRIQSPAVLVELDHHQAVFLTNSEPARFHIHTLARTPEGGDYGMDVLAARTEAEA